MQSTTLGEKIQVSIKLGPMLHRKMGCNNANYTCQKENQTCMIGPLMCNFTYQLSFLATSFHASQPSYDPSTASIVLPALVAACSPNASQCPPVWDLILHGLSETAEWCWAKAKSDCAVGWYRIRQKLSEWWIENFLSNLLLSGKGKGD